MRQYISVFIVDDEVSGRESVKKILTSRQSPFKIIGEAGNGAEALDFIRIYHPDIVITDVVMPVMNGVSFIEILERKYPEIRVIVLSSYSEFDYVKGTLRHGAVDYVLKPMLNQSTLFSALKQASGHLAQKEDDPLPEEVKFSRKLSEYILNPNLPAMDEEVSSCFTYPNFAILYTNGNYASDLQIISDFMMQELGSYLNNCKAAPFCLTDSRFALLLNYTGKTGSLKEKLEQKIKVFKKNEPDTFFTMSQPFHCLNELRGSYKTLSAKSHQMRFFYKNELLVTEDRLFTPNRNSDFFTNQYYFSVSTQNYSVILNDLLSELEKLTAKRTHPETLKKICTSVLFSVYLMLENTFQETNHSFAGEQIQVINQISDIKYESDFLHVTRQVVQDLDSRIHALADGADQNLLIGRMLAYVNEHYGEKITLNSLADRFHFSTGYLSKYFTTHFNESFNDYLNRVRIQHSYELLKCHDLNISEVAEKCGYSDISYFSRVFKKHTGKTPSQVKRNI